MNERSSLFSSIKEKYDESIMANQAVADGILTLWINRESSQRSADIS